MDITLHIPDDIARNLMAEAASRHITVEELAAERIESRRVPARDRPDYVALAMAGSKSPSARKSVEQIDADIDAVRDEW
jgi:hypothetical protein